MLGSNLSAAILREDFSAPPAGHGWRIHGDASLFAWNAADGNLEVTWDSRRTNSYFLHPLGTTLTRGDDFQLTFDLRLDDLTVGIDPAKPDTFQVAIGLIHADSALATNFFRGAGTSASWGPRNLVEFDYFPDSGFGDTWALTAVSTNRRWAYAHTFPLTLTTGDWFRLRLEYSGATREGRLTAWRNGTPFGLPPGPSFEPLQLAATTLFTDFRVDSLAICSYSDAHQPAIAGSLLAHGRVDNLELVHPDPAPVLAGTWSPGGWQLSFASRRGWRYQLEASANLIEWNPAGDAVVGTGGIITLATGVDGTRRFHRVAAFAP